MMSKERVKQLKAVLEDEAREISRKRMSALDRHCFEEMSELDHKFWEKIAEISIVTHILNY